jgi:hypothetical protein
LSAIKLAGDLNAINGFKPDATMEELREELMTAREEPGGIEPEIGLARLAASC